MNPQDLGIGRIITTPQQRDAIHMAVAPVEAAMRLSPGMNVGLNEQGRATNRTENPIGVIDPFLKQPAEKGEKVWLFLYPGTIKGLRHEWQHPAFLDSPTLPIMPNCEKSTSELWVRDYVKRNCPYYDEPDVNRSGRDGYEEFLGNARCGEIFYYGSDLHGLYELEEGEELFRHLSVLLGRPVGGESFTYSCSC